MGSGLYVNCTFDGNELVRLSQSTLQEGSPLFSAELLSRCWFLCGPTACGKTEVSLVLSERLNAEIVALDSMTLYRGMDIGTAKPSLDERTRVPHHLINVLEPYEEYSLAQYVAAAEQACAQIVARGRRPLFVGGTGLYLRGVLRGVFAGPAADWDLRKELDQQLQQCGAEALHHQLQQVDPVTASRLHPNDARRVIRALEVFRLTGQPLSAQHEQEPRSLDQRTPHVYWLSPPRDWLYQRINHRVQQMFQKGLMDEVRGLIQLPRPLSHTARQALGYKEVIDWLESGSADEASVSAGTIDLIQTRTRQFAKRQHTWFRNLEECIPIPMNGSESPTELAQRISQAKE
jgi:tRNA dimethylallyltransferase